MNKLLAITVLIALLSYGADSFRVLRQVEEEESSTLETVTNTLLSYWDTSVETASGWWENIKNWKLDEKAKNLYDETTTAASTYGGIMQDQLYHIFYSS